MSKNKSIVLIADDEEDLTWSISRSFSRDNKNIKLLCANSGDETVSLLKQHHVDVLVTDLRMPGLDGYGVIDYVNDQPLSTKIIVITAYGSSETEKEIMKKTCCYDYLEKPFEMSALKQKVYSIIDQKDGHDGSEGNVNHQIKRIISLSNRTSNLLLTIYNDDQEGKLYLMNGKIYRAVLGKKKGEAAIREIMSWKRGFIKAQTGYEKFSFDS